jgi:hypothetical protein
LKLVKPRCNLDCRRFSFSNRIINEWNKLSDIDVAYNSVNSFRHKVDLFLKGQGFI